MDLPGLLALVDSPEAGDELLALFRNLVTFPTVNTGVMPTGHVMSHLDVVPPGDTARWSVPPFEAVYRDGWVWGRGANDCKGLVAAEVMALRLLARRRVKLRGDIRLVCGADEECGGRYGFGWLAAEHADRLRADLGVNEGGGGLVRLAGGGYGCCVANGEKGRHEVIVRVHGRSGHASMPWLAESPFGPLEELLRRLASYRPELDVESEPMQTIAQVWGVPCPAAAELDAFLAARQPADAEEVHRYRAMSRMTWAPTVVRAGEKSNAIPDGLELRLDARTLPHQDGAWLRGELDRVLGDIPGVSVAVETTAEASRSALSSTARQALGSALAAAGEPVKAVLPSLCSGFTDARLVRPLGTPVYGFAPLPPGIDLARVGCHNLDEQFPLEAVRFRTKVLLALACEWCG
ncbi:MAG: M20/M25/M40 family metallo-hydrolase [Armatimonadetes bacterium]|nr:M20/M25/M40 family metallo-hydrolase [Armatimonadota bacterium]